MSQATALAQTPRLRKGALIRHPAFGTGSVVSSDPVYTSVAFDSDIRKFSTPVLYRVLSSPARTPERKPVALPPRIRRVPSAGLGARRLRALTPTDCRDHSLGCNDVPPRRSGGAERRRLGAAMAPRRRARSSPPARIGGLVSKVTELGPDALKLRPYYDYFSWQASIPFDCPLCGVHIPAGLIHECSNPKPKTQTQRRKSAPTDKEES